jgi:hypothetical protein
MRTEEIHMTQYTTAFASIDNYKKGGLQLLNDDAKRYVFSNIYDVAANSKDYQRTVVAKNLDYTIECIRANGDSKWYICAHDEFVVAMDYEVEVHFKKMSPDFFPDEEKDGSVAVDPKNAIYMGKVTLKRGHMALLPENTAYSFKSSKPSTLMLQSILGDLSEQRWADICEK